MFSLVLYVLSSIGDSRLCFGIFKLFLRMRKYMTDYKRN
jgi:hypothetical protein